MRAQRAVGGSEFSDQVPGRRTLEEAAASNRRVVLELYADMDAIRRLLESASRLERQSAAVVAATRRRREQLRRLGL